MKRKNQNKVRKLDFYMTIIAILILLFQVIFINLSMNIKTIINITFYI